MPSKINLSAFPNKCWLFEETYVHEPMFNRCVIHFKVIVVSPLKGVAQASLRSGKILAVGTERSAFVHGGLSGKCGVASAECGIGIG